MKTLSVVCQPRWRQILQSEIDWVERRRERLVADEIDRPADLKETTMSKLRVNAFTVSADGFGAGLDQGRDRPLGRGGEHLHEWFIPTRTFQQAVQKREGGTTGVDDDFAARCFREPWRLDHGPQYVRAGAWALAGRQWKGWWGDNPPYHVPVFVLTHHPRPPLEMEGGTTSISSRRGSRPRWNRREQSPRARTYGSAAAPPPSASICRHGLIDEMHLAISPILLGRGEPLFEGLDLPALGYRVKKHVFTEAAMHLVVER